MEDHVISMDFSTENWEILEEDQDDVENFAQSISNNAKIVLSCDASEVEKRITWSDVATKHLLHLVKENMEKVGKSTTIKTKTKMWKIIAEGMEAIGKTYSAVQVESKFRGLERQYKKMVLNNKSTGRARITIPFQTELEEILSNKKGVNPVFVLGGEISELSESSAPDSPIEQTPTKKPRFSTHERTLQTLNDLREDQNRQHAEIIKLLKEKEENREKRAQRKDELLNKLLEKL